MSEIISLEDLPDCETCNDPTRRIDGTIFDCPGLEKIAPTYTCENILCRSKLNAVCSYILRQCMAEKEE